MYYKLEKLETKLLLVVHCTCSYNTLWIVCIGHIFYDIN